MDTWFLVLAAATVGSVLSLAGGVYLLKTRKAGDKLQKLAVPFAAGALLAAAFLDLLPEAIHEGGEDALTITLVGLLCFFVLERGLSWFHHHHEEDASHTHTRRNVWLIVIGDTLHNFLDGLAIGAAFLLSPATGAIAAVAIAAHEIPQEIGDFALMLSKGMAAKRVLLVNLSSALVTILGAALVYGLGDGLPIPEASLLAITAGFFIYIAASDIIPSIHAEQKRRLANIQTVVLIIGVIFVGVTSQFAHSFLPHEESHGTHEEH